MRNVFLCLTLVLSTAAYGVAADAGPEVPAGAAETVRFAPLNPEFEAFMKNPVILGNAPSGVALGYIPPPVDMSYLTGLVPQAAVEAAYPATYDLRTTGKLTPVRDQGACGSCWSFAAMGSLESGLMPGEPRDFSENNLKNTAGFDRGPCDGGNDWMSMAYLMRWSGPVNESDDPYQPNDNPSPPNLTVQKHAQNLTVLPGRSTSTGNDVIKAAVISHGAVATSMMWDDAYFNTANNAYYFGGSANTNHAVDIVGWDDNFPASRFNSAPPGNGAFLIRNSWGSSFGDSGYFYISYYDSKVGKSLVVYSPPETTNNFSRIYSYDPLGVVYFFGYSTPTLWFANVFTPPASESISAASFFNNDVNSTYEVRLYTNLANPADPRSGTLQATKTGTLSNAGYATIRFDAPVPVSAGQKFSVVVKLVTPNTGFPGSVEAANPGYSSAAVSSPGQSFYSSGGTTWYDLTSYDSTANFCIKAYAAASTIDTTDHIGVYRGGGWFLDKNGNGAWDSGTDTVATFGIPGDIPVSGNWTGTGSAKIGVFRNGAWYLDMNGNGAWDTGTDAAYNFGIPTDIPVTGKWTGGATTKIGVFRNGAWYLDTNGNGTWDAGDTAFTFGIPGDKPVTGDWNGSGTTKIGVVRGGSSWFLDTNGNGAWNVGVDTVISGFGIPGDRPVTGNW